MYELNQASASALNNQFQARAGMGMPSVPEPRIASQWETAAKRHADILSHLTEQIKVLADRLHPVLRPVAPTPTSGQTQAKQSEPLAPVAAGLHQICDEVDHLNYIVGDILSRLEL